MRNRKAGAESRELQIGAADGHVVPGTLVCTGKGRIVIMSHGITGDRDEEGVHSRFAHLLSEQGFDSMRFDFRGRGKSAMASRDATISGMMLDFMAVVDWARKGYAGLFHVATSFGAAITLLCARRFSFADFSAVAFWNPVVDFERVFVHPSTEWGRKYFGHVDLQDIPRQAGIPLSNGKITVGPPMMMELVVMTPRETAWPPSPPLLMVHGDADGCVPFEDSQSYAGSNAASATLYRLPGVNHGFGERLSEACAVTLDWFNENKH